MLCCILGKSGSGKDTIVKELLEYNKDIKVAISYTTRPMRKNETNGVEYNFITEKQFMDKLSKGEFIETREYKVINESGQDDIWHYGLAYDSFTLNEDYMVIVDPQGLKALKEKLGDALIISFYIFAEEGIRLNRCTNRENITHEKLDEINRRFKADEKDFANDKIDNLDYYLINNNLDNLQQNVEFINKEILLNKDKDLVECVLTGHYLDKELTKGKIYNAEKMVYGEVKVINNLGKSKWYNIGLFKSLR